MQDHAGDGEQRLVGGLVHQVAAHRENVLARPEFLAAQAAVFAQRLDRTLQVLDVGGRLLVDDDEVDHHAAGAHILLETQRLGDDLQVGDVADPDQEDREIARNAGRPQARLLAQPRGDGFGGETQERIRIDQIARQLLHVCGIGQAEAHMAGLHLAAGPGEHGLAGEALRMVEPGDGLLQLSAVGADDGPEGQRYLLVGGHAHLAAQRGDRDRA